MMRDHISRRTLLRRARKGGLAVGVALVVPAVLRNCRVVNAPHLTGVAGDTRNDLTWGLVACAAKTRIERAVGTGAYSTIYTGTATTLADTSLTNGTVYHYRARGVDSKGRLGPSSAIVTLTPTAAPVPDPGPGPGPDPGPGPGPGTGPFVIYGWGQGTTGGTGGTVYNVSTYAAMKTALEASGKRIVNVTGSTVFDMGGDSVSITHGDLTWSGSGWTGSTKNGTFLVRASNVIITNLALRPGEGSSPSASTDRRALSLIPPTGGSINHIVVDRLSGSWGPDVTLSILNNVDYITVQFSIVGPALDNSNIPSSPNGYDQSLTTSGTDATKYPKHVTLYRNLYAIFDERGIRAESGDWIEAINCAVYDAGKKPSGGNCQHISVMGCMFKKGPESAWVGGANNAWNAQIAGGVFTSYFASSVYFPVAGDTAAPEHANIGITAAGATFVPDRTFGGSSKRTTPYASAPNYCTVTAASVAFFAQVVSQAGRTYQDATDTAVKAHALAGTSDGFYNGAGFPAPHPSW